MNTTEVIPLETLVKNYALEVGFDLVGISSADPFDAHKRVTLQRIRDGLMDGLPWFNPSRVERGADPQSLLPGARSVISVALSYHLSANGKPRNLEGRVARYAWGDDYHKLMKKRLKLYVRGLSERIGRHIKARWYVDDGPMLDRAAAQRAGVGWFGKNTNVLTSTHGSWVFLGQVITDLELKPDPPLKKNCGSCTLCLQACPTGALPAPYVIDNERCISHQTIENRGDIPLEIRPLMSDWVFGCDICQDVCPVNVNALYTREQAFKKKRFTTLQLIEILEMTDEEFRRRFSNSPLKRAKLVGLKRNACVALGNAADPAAIPALTRALNEDQPLVRRHAAWALGRIGGDEAHASLQRALPSQTDPTTRREIKSALATFSSQPPIRHSREGGNPYATLSQGITSAHPSYPTRAHPDQTPSAHPEPVEGSSVSRHSRLSPRHSRAGRNPPTTLSQGITSAHPEPVEGSSVSRHSRLSPRHSRAGGNPSSPFPLDPHPSFRRKPESSPSVPPHPLVPAKAGTHLLSAPAKAEDGGETSHPPS